MDHGPNEFNTLFIFLWDPDFASESVSVGARNGDAVEADEGDVLSARGGNPAGRGIGLSGTEVDALGGFALTCLSLIVDTGSGVRFVLPEGDRLLLVRHGECPFAGSAVSRLM